LVAGGGVVIFLDSGECGFDGVVGEAGGFDEGGPAGAGASFVAGSVEFVADEVEGVDAGEGGHRVPAGRVGWCGMSDARGDFGGVAAGAPADAVGLGAGDGAGGDGVAGAGVALAARRRDRGGGSAGGRAGACGAVQGWF
jgi:hypothetical protein